MIVGFANDATRELFEKGTYRGWSEKLCRVAGRKLDQLNNARSVHDMRHPPGNKLHALEGNRAGQYAIWVNDQYRLCFRFEGQNTVDVEVTDYHDKKRRT